MRKRLFDVFAAFWLLILVSPLLLAIALAIRLDSRGPVIFRQARIGRARREFIIWKFRTLRHESGLPLDIVVKGDVRVTRVGRFLRATHLDELPQLYNILRGEMSFVGPRPITLEILRYHEERDPELRFLIRQRFSARPGLTGLYQVHDRATAWSNGTAACSNDLWTERLCLDLEYLREQSFTLDLAILFRTIPMVLMARGA